MSYSPSPMPSPMAEQKLLRQRLDAAYAETAAPVSRDEVAEIVREVVASMGGDMSGDDLKLYAELEDLARYIADAKAELAALRPAEIRDEHIPTATDELDAVVGATEQATFAIFDACDIVSGVAGSVDADNGAKLTDAVTRIYEACNFQDITGQRITKVVRTLKHIEAKVDALLAVFGEEARHAAAAPAPAPVPAEPSADPDAGLLHGPSLPGNAIDQDEIDRLLASFD
ncbi:protein phosphatase CheZ [Azospirillum sp.]|uniref:protein phosphatase CheZ n=1 Tax=Azospirillum sp. TaxID=34012 RepID=UPI002D483316|nr:protein phosphatase CheZ [Azospirillum sp.]HYD67467.1 protein phosphatase CheZ [Azospirillum sp.]